MEFNDEADDGFVFAVARRCVFLTAADGMMADHRPLATASSHRHVRCSLSRMLSL